MALHHNPRIVTSGLVLHLDPADKNSYPGTGISCKNLSGDSNNGSLSGGVTYSNLNNGIFILDGIDDYVAVPDSNSLDITDNITISFWFNVYAYTLALYSVNFFKKFVNTNTANFIFYFDGTFTPKKLLVYANRGGVWSSVSPTTGDIPINTWTHITWTYNSVTGGFLYVYGNRLSTVGVGSGVLATNSTEVAIGDKLNGAMASSQIYNRVLTAEEVLQNYNALKGRFGL